MTENLILKSQANEIFQLLKGANLSPEDFELTTVPSIFDHNMKVSILIHKNSGYYFQFDFRNRSHYCRFSPGDSKIEEDQYPGNWPFQAQRFALLDSNIWKKHLLD